MKNLILTFVFALVSLVSFTQGGTYNVNTSIDTTINITVLDTIKFHIVDGYSIENIKIIDQAGPTQLFDFTNNLGIDELNFTQYVSSIGSYEIMFISAGMLYKTVFVNIGTASTSENTLTREELKVYPSPATSDIKISFSADKSDMPLNIFSLNGQLVHQDNTSREVGAINIIELNVSSWSAGIYLANNGKETFKFVVL